MSGHASESSPLIGPSHALARRKTRASAGKSSRGYVLAVTLALIVLVDFASVFMDAPQTSILEEIICDRYYSAYATSSALRDCTTGPVQAELATVNQLLKTFNILPGMLVAIPFGMLADRHGRRPVLVLGLAGIFIQDLLAKIVCWRHDAFPPRLIWATAAARLIGGGDVVASSMTYLIVADVTPADQRANHFFVLSACILVGDVIAIPLSAFLMSKNPWVPYIIGGVLTFLGGIIPVMLLPETLPRVDRSDMIGQPSVVFNNNQPDAAPSLTEAAPASKSPKLLAKLRNLAGPNVIAVLLAFFVSSLGRQSTGFLLQYVRQRFNWSYEKASFLIALRGSVHLLLLLVGLPAFNMLLTRYELSIPAKDLFISRISVFLLALGSLIISTAPLVQFVTLGVAIFALGSGFAPAARSLATTLVQPDQVGTLYSALGLMQSAGGLLAGPMLAGSFRWAVDRGREWTGAPFLLVAAIFGFSLLAMSFVRLQDFSQAARTSEEQIPEDGT